MIDRHGLLPFSAGTASLIALIVGAALFTTLDTRPAEAQFGGFNRGFRGAPRVTAPRMMAPPRMGGMQRMPGMGRGQMGDGGMRGGMTRGGMSRGEAMRDPGMHGPGGRGPYGEGGRYGRPGRTVEDGYGRPGRTVEDGYGRPGRQRYPGGNRATATGGRDTYPDRPGRPGRPGSSRPPTEGYPTRPPRPPIATRPPRYPLPPVVVLPPGGPPRLPPGGPPMGPPPGGPPMGGPPFGGPPMGGPPMGPRFVAPAIAIPALVTAARSANGQGAPGLPAANERRYVPDEVLFVMRPDAPPAAVQAVVRRFNLTLIAENPSPLLGTTIHRYRVPNRLTVPAAIRAMTRANGIAYVQPNYMFDRPNYVFRLQSASTTPGGGASLQYVVDTLRLPEAHLMARGEQVPIAVIDSGIEATHPEMAGRVAKSFDAVGGAFQAHEHGTGMAGAIVAHAQLTGISPRASILAARAFAPGQPAAGAQGTSYHILQAMDWSVREGAKVINMSFAGPRDPMMTRAIAVAAERRIVLIAAMGNEGPTAPVSFPAADPNVIAVTATDQAGRLFAAASRGGHVTVAAPGVDILLPAPRGGYQVSSGTSVAAAHVSGIAALLLERQPNLDPAHLREILRRTARTGTIPEPELGAGLADPVPALNAAAPSAPPPAPMVSTPPPAPVPETAIAPTTPGPDTAQLPQPPRQATVPPAISTPPPPPETPDKMDDKN